MALNSLASCRGSSDPHGDEAINRWETEKGYQKRTLANNNKLAKLWDYKAGILSGIDLLDEAARVDKRK